MERLRGYGAASAAARANEIVGERDGVLVVRVTAPPVDGRANDALCRLIAKRARVGVRRVSVVRGAGAREKVVRVQGIEPSSCARRCGAVDGGVSFPR